jgi:hypothetical protein
MRRVGLLVLALVVSGAGAQAQTVEPRGTAGVVLGGGRTWDDESNIGGGAVAGGRAAWRVFGTTSLEVSADVLGHDRSGGFFEAEGRSVILGVSLLHRFGDAAAQPYLLGGRRPPSHGIDNVRRLADRAPQYGSRLSLRGRARGADRRAVRGWARSTLVHDPAGGRIGPGVRVLDRRAARGAILTLGASALRRSALGASALGASALGASPRRWKPCATADRVRPSAGSAAGGGDAWPARRRTRGQSASPRSRRGRRTRSPQASRTPPPPAP